MATLLMIESWLQSTGRALPELIKRREHDYVLVTRDPALYQDHPVREHAADVLVTETNDQATLVAAVCSDPRRIDGVLTTCDYYLEGAAYCARALGVPGPSPHVMRTATRKDLVRDATARAGQRSRGCTVRHAIDRHGRPLLLSRRGDVLDELRGTGGVNARLNVADVPPLVDAPSYGRAVVAGHARPLSTADALAVVDEFAEANPVSDLFDVGADVSMFAIDVDWARLERDDVTTNVPPSEYAAAAPDPLHESEAELLCDLADHHAAQVESFIRHELCEAGVEPAAAPRPVRLDRYGFLVDIGGTTNRWARLEFTRTVGSQHDLAHLLHPVLFHGQCCCCRTTAD